MNNNAIYNAYVPLLYSNFNANTYSIINYTTNTLVFYYKCEYSLHYSMFLTAHAILPYGCRHTSTGFINACILFIF